MKKLLFVSLLAASTAWAQGPASFFAVDFTAGGPLPSELTFNYMGHPVHGSTGGFVPEGWQFVLPGGGIFDTWGGVDDCARVTFEAGSSRAFAVQTHLTGFVNNGDNAAGIIVYVNRSGETRMFMYGPYNNELRMEGPRDGAQNA